MNSAQNDFLRTNAEANYPEGKQLATKVRRRRRSGLVWRVAFQLATIVGIIALSALLYNIINQAFGLAAVVNAVEPETLVQRYQEAQGPTAADGSEDQSLQLADLPTEVLVSMLANSINEGVGRRMERDQRFFADYLVFEQPESYLAACDSASPHASCSLPPRSHQDIYQLVLERVVQPDVVRTWLLTDSLFRRDAIAHEIQEMQEDFPGARLEFRSWLSPTFVTSAQNPEPAIAGVRTAILGSIWVIVITVLFSFPVGVGAAIYLEEYAADNRLNRLIQTNINNLAGVPSIVYGMLGLAIFVRVLEVLTSGAIFGTADPTTANGRTILSAGLTLGLLILPIVIINAQEAIRAVPPSLREASYGLGATRLQTVWSHVLPNALPGILTGAILSMSRAIGETAPLVVVGASTFITVDPSGPFSKFTTLPIQIYQWTSRPQGEFRNIAAAAIIVLLVLLLSMNAGAVLLRNRFSKRLT